MSALCIDMAAHLRIMQDRQSMHSSAYRQAAAQMLYMREQRCQRVQRCRYRKRGLAVLATKFGISFTFQPMNQAGATVSVYLDGSVGLVHGGIEMGQGLHTKMCQVAAQALGVPLDVRRFVAPAALQRVLAGQHRFDRQSLDATQLSCCSCKARIDALQRAEIGKVY